MISDTKVDISSALEVSCNDCKGKGNYAYDDNEIYMICTECEGTGFVLTKLGEEVFGFLSRAKQREDWRISHQSIVTH